MRRISIEDWLVFPSIMTGLLLRPLTLGCVFDWSVETWLFPFGLFCVTFDVTPFATVWPWRGVVWKADKFAARFTAARDSTEAELETIDDKRVESDWDVDEGVGVRCLGTWRWFSSKYASVVSSAWNSSIGIQLLPTGSRINNSASIQSRSRTSME